MKKNLILVCFLCLFRFILYGQCSIIQPGYSTNFSGLPPTCWKEATNGTPTTGGPVGVGSGAWGRSRSSAQINLYDNNTSDWLLSPYFDLSNGPWDLVITNHAADYRGGGSAFSGMGADDSVQVVISMDSGATWIPIHTWDINNLPSLNSNDLILDLSAYTGTSCQFGIWASDGAIDNQEDYYIYIEAFEIRTPPSCYKPSMFNAQNITATSAMLNWAVYGSPASWEVSYGIAGTSAGAGTVVNTTNTSYSITNLVGNTEYDCYVRAICGSGDTSAWTGPINFTTLCGVYTPNYVTRFANNFPVDCWKVAGSGTPATGPTAIGYGLWLQHNSSARINLYYNTKREWLLTPEFDLSGGSWELVLAVHATDDNSTNIFSGMGTDDTVQVVISTDNGVTWNPIYTWDANNLPPINSGDVILDLSAYQGTSNLFGIWASDGSVNDVTDYYFYVDKFEIRTPPTCYEPHTLNVNDITAYTAQASWEYTGAATTWELSYGVAGTLPNAGVKVVTTDTFYNITGLSGSTEHDYYVRTICSTGDTSSWRGPLTFKTLCGVYNNSYSTDFLTFLPDCWAQSTSGTPTTGPTGMGSSSWSQSSASARVNLHTNSRSEWLLSPEFDLSFYNNWEMAITVHAYDYSNSSVLTNMGADDSVQVVISTDNGATWTALYTWDINNLPSITRNEVVIDLSAYQGTSNLFGIWASDGSVDNQEDYYFYVDKFEIRRGIPPPPRYEDLVITEIMYDAPEGQDSTEFIEIYNRGTTTIDLTGITLTGGINYTFPTSSLAPNTYYVVANNMNGFVSTYSVLADGMYTGSLNDSSAFIILMDTIGNVIDSVHYDNGSLWSGNGNIQGSPAGGGASITLCNPFTDNADGSNWSASVDTVGVVINGKNLLASPGNSSSCIAIIDLVVDSLLLEEVYCNVDSINSSFILTNNSDVAVSTITYEIIKDQQLFLEDTIPMLAAHASTTVTIPTFALATGAQEIVVIVTKYGDSNPLDNIQSRVMYSSNIAVSIATTATINCNGDATGGLNGSVTGAYGASSYLWSNGQTTTRLNNLMAGTYMLTVTDSTGCTDDTTMILSEPLPVLITGSATDIICNGESNGLITTSTTGGITPYTYLWSNGDTISDLANLSNGSYTLTVTDANGCEKIQSYLINEPRTLTTNIVHDNISSATVFAQGGVAPYTYLWSANIGNATTNAVSNLVHDTTYYVTVTDDNGCTQTDSVNIGFIKVPTIEKVGGLAIYPNPAGEQVFVDINLTILAPVEIRITNVVGQVVDNYILGNVQVEHIELSTENLTNGVYWIQFQIGEEQITRKLLVRKNR